MPTSYFNYIKGERMLAGNGETFEQRNPANLEVVTGIWPASTRDDAKGAVEAAEKAYPMWSSLTVYQRAEYLKKAHQAMTTRREELAEVITLENGKTLRESLLEVDSAILEMEYQIHEGLRLFGKTTPSTKDGVFAYSVRVPLGVVSIISPWNFPLNVPVRKITPALIAGNTCVFKPSSLTPQCGYKLMELYIEAGLPKGVLNFITGSGSTVGEEITSNPAIKAISFTGSTEAGRKIHQKAAGIMARTQLEMGGKNPVIIFEDADLDGAAESAVTAAFACAGQWCTSTSRAIVVHEVIDNFIQLVLQKVRRYCVGDGRDPNVTMGPVCGKVQHDTILQFIDTGKKEGAVLSFGGVSNKKEHLSGCFIQPTVFTCVTPDMTIAREEIFGPVLCIMEVRDFEEAIEVANGVDFGLSSSIYTESITKAFTFLEKTNVGLTHLNMMTAFKEPQLSFGGVKASGIGIPEAGDSGMQFFTNHKVGYIKYR